MRKKNRETETFSLSFLDAVTCGFGAVILLLVLVKIYEPTTIERSREELEGILARLQEEVFDIRGQTEIFSRDMVTVDEQLSESKLRLARLRGELSKIQGQYAASKDSAMIESDERGELAAARQRLTEEMQRLLANYRPDERDTTVGGVPVDSEYIVFVIDTSGSMRQFAWSAVLKKVQEALAVYPTVRGIQVLNDEGKYMFPSYAGRWIPDSPSTRQTIISRLSTWDAFSDSVPTEGIEVAIKTFYEPGKPMSIYILGDDFAGRQQVEAVARWVDRVNQADEFGNRLVRIHGIGFPVHLESGNVENAVRFANLLRTLAERNGGTFVALTSLR